MRRNSGKRGVLSSRYRYIYCLIPSRKKCFLKLRGVGGAEISTIHYKDIAAVVSEATDERYEILDDGLFHENVVESVQQNYCVLPMGFGQIATEQDIRAFIIRNYSHLKHLFSKLEGRRELGIKVVWRTEALMREIIASDSRINHLHKEITSLPEAAAYNNKIKIGKIAEAEIKKKGETIASDIISQLKAQSDNFCLNQNLTDEMLLNAAFLVKNEDEDKFDHIVDGIEKKFRDLVEIRYVISPPYDFADLRIGR